MTNMQTTHRSEQGFTLVELAIVMVIIGLLIGGILKGQELIANARVSSTVTQLKGLDAAMNTFQDKYNALAGDMNGTENRLPNGDAAENGNGDGRITGLAGALPAGEGVEAFSHLSRADLISGIIADGGVAFGQALPTVSVGGGMWLGTSSANGAATAAPAGSLRGNTIYAALQGTPVAFTANGGSIPVLTMAQIDRKMDDGAPESGSVFSRCSAGGVAAAAYVENSTGTCGAYVRILN